MDNRPKTWFQKLVERDALIARLARLIWFRARVRVASVATSEELDRWAEDGGAV